MPCRFLDKNLDHSWTTRPSCSLICSQCLSWKYLQNFQLFVTVSMLWLLEISIQENSFWLVMSGVSEIWRIFNPFKGVSDLEREDRYWFWLSCGPESVSGDYPLQYNKKIILLHCVVCKFSMFHSFSSRFVSVRNKSYKSEVIYMCINV